MGWAWQFSEGALETMGLVWKSRYRLGFVALRHAAVARESHTLQSAPVLRLVQHAQRCNLL